MRCRSVLLSAALAAALLGCSTAPAEESGSGASEVDSPTPASPAEPTASPDQSGSPSQEAEADPNDEAGELPRDVAHTQALLAAADTAQSTAEGAKVYAVESENAATQWEVELVTPDGERLEVKVSGDGATVVSGPTTESSEPKHLQRVSAATIPLADIVDAALGEVDGTIVELGLDTENGVIVWEVEIVTGAGSEVDVNIDAATGEVLG